MQESMNTLSRTAGPIALGATPGSRPLALWVGHSTRTVAGKLNEDCYGMVTASEEPSAVLRGVAIAIADGVSASGQGRRASEIAITTVLRDYYATPDSWHVSVAIDRVLRSVNDWLLMENLRQPELDGAVTTFSLLLFRPGRYYLVHVGDTRIYRRRRGALSQLSHDHTWQRRDMRHVLKRAVGLDTFLVADYADGDLQNGDTFLMASDGVWEVVGERGVRETLVDAADPQAVAEELTERSMRNQVQYMGRNDATAIVIAVNRHPSVA
jgi:serine/threonine protein phosphatase PrpC